MISTPLNETQFFNREELFKTFEQTLDYVEEAYANGTAAHEVELGCNVQYGIVMTAGRIGA